MAAASGSPGGLAGWVQHFGPLIAAMLAAGLFAGLVAGMFGIGGGFVVVPALAAAFTAFSNTNVAPGEDHIMHVAIGTSLATIIFTSFRSVQAHARRGAVDFAILKDWMWWVVLGVVAGAVTARFLDGGALKIVFGVGVLLMGLHFVFPIIGRNVPEQENLPKGPLRALLGSALGAVSSVLGIGGGTPAVLIMTMSGVNAHRAVATAAGFGAVIAIPGALANILLGWNQPNLPYGSIGFVNVFALIAIVAMSVLTAPIGVAAAHAMDAKVLKRVFGVYLLFTAAVMLRDSIPLDFVRAAHAAIAPTAR
ncbi:MAG: TSUP family transporter [Alphaproteobacteria bacterium]|nr:TSUP family transporter [Alphaproteobacteria bacterium]